MSLLRMDEYLWIWEGQVKAAIAQLNKMVQWNDREPGWSECYNVAWSDDEDRQEAFRMMAGKLVHAGQQPLEVSEGRVEGMSVLWVRHT